MASRGYSRRVELAAAKLEALGIDPGGRNAYSVYRGLPAQTREASARMVHTSSRGQHYVRMAGDGSRRQRFVLPGAGELVRTYGDFRGLGTVERALERLQDRDQGVREVRVSATFHTKGGDRTVAFTTTVDELLNDGVVDACADAAAEMYGGGAWGGATPGDVQVYIAGG